MLTVFVSLQLCSGHLIVWLKQWEGQISLFYASKPLKELKHQLLSLHSEGGKHLICGSSQKCVPSNLKYVVGILLGWFRCLNVLKKIIQNMFLSFLLQLFFQHSVSLITYEQFSCITFKLYPTEQMFPHANSLLAWFSVIANKIESKIVF